MAATHVKIQKLNGSHSVLAIASLQLHSEEDRDDYWYDMECWSAEAACVYISKEEYNRLEAILLDLAIAKVGQDV